MAKNYYVTLGISRGADLNQIKRAYRKVAKKYHPDSTRSDDSRQFREIREAYETLADENARRHYDAQLQRPPALVRIASVTEAIQLKVSGLKTNRQISPSPALRWRSGGCCSTI